jgi:hypothetical protein
MERYGSSAGKDGDDCAEEARRSQGYERAEEAQSVRCHRKSSSFSATGSFKLMSDNDRTKYFQGWNKGRAFYSALVAWSA